MSDGGFCHYCQKSNCICVSKPMRVKDIKPEEEKEGTAPQNWRKVMAKNVHYELAMRKRAMRERKWLVTVSVDGKHLKDGSWTVQGLVDLRMAKRLTKVGLAVLNHRSKAHP